MKIDKLIRQIKTNRVLNILLNPKGEITRKEYWFGLIILLMLSNTQIAKHAYFALFNFVLQEYGNGSTEYALSPWGFNGLTGAIDLPLIPQQCIILYSAFILTFKRAGEQLSSPTKWMAGTFTYLFFNSLPSIYTLVTNILSFAESSLEFDLTTVSYTLYILLSFVALGIISIIAISSLWSNCSRNENSFGSVNYTIKNFIVQVILGAIFLVFTLIVRADPYMLYFSIIPGLISLCFSVILIYFMTRRAMDAGIGWYVPILIFVGLLVLIGAYVLYIFVLHGSNAFLDFVLIPSFIFFILTTINILYFILMALPSKYNEGEDKKVETSNNNEIVITK